MLESLPSDDFVIAGVAFVIVVFDWRQIALIITGKPPTPNNAPYLILVVFYSLLLIAALGAGIYTSARWRKLPKEERKGFIQKAILWSAAVIILLLVLAGRAPWLMGVLAALLALASRVAQFAQYIPMAKKIFGETTDRANSDSSASPSVSAMSRQEAADILGIEIDADHEEVRAAHKKLIQKLHPDRGGSDALAKQINRAKDCLLS